MARRPDAAGFGPILLVLSALGLLASTAAGWIEQPTARSIGDVAVAEVRVTAGIEVTPLAVVVALGGLVCGVVLLVTRGAARRMVSLLAVGVGIAAVVVVGVGVTRLPRLDGVWTPAPWLALAASAGMLAAGLLGLGGPARRLPARYDVDAPPDDAEWEIAADPDDGRRELP
ncbi:MAG: hypothetical protein KY460_10000 [Actinobacteria bacterium]|nr:hypothetical protein [Actinomycetota bacterium]